LAVRELIDQLGRLDTSTDMEWYSWLSRAGLAASLTYEYGLLFTQNELEPGDAAHFDHDLLKSMGIAVAKHRLEILKLAKKQAAVEGGRNHDASAAARLARGARRCLARCVRRLAVGTRRGASSVTVVPRICSGDDAVRVGAVQKRSAAKKMVLMITDGGCGLRGGDGGAARRLSTASSQKASLMFQEDGSHEDEEERSSQEEIRWDSMFQDLKPT
jgi:hypothetical protein